MHVDADGLAHRPGRAADAFARHGGVVAGGAHDPDGPFDAHLLHGAVDGGKAEAQQEEAHYRRVDGHRVPPVAIVSDGKLVDGAGARVGE